MNKMTTNFNQNKRVYEMIEKMFSENNYRKNY